MPITIPASVIDNALANVSDVPQVHPRYKQPRGWGIESPEVLCIRFTGNGDPTLWDLLHFISRLPEEFREAFMQPGEEKSFTGYCDYTFSDVTVEGDTRYFNEEDW